MRTILVIEDEQSIADTVAHCIEREGHAAVWCERGLDGLERVKTGDYALVVLDVGLPDISGFELCKAIRKFSHVPVIFLTARDDEIDKIVGLEIGADDYVTKPFSPRELAARIKTVLRRMAPAQDAPWPRGGAGALPGGPECASHAGRARQDEGPGAVPEKRLHIDPVKLQAAVAGRKLELTRYEFKLLALLAAHPGKVYSREAIMDAVWGADTPSLDRTVDAHVKSLRAKFREMDEACDPILTHRGTGYALRDDL